MAKYMKAMYSTEYVFDMALNAISYPLFADADRGIYPQAASQYHA